MCGPEPDSRRCNLLQLSGKTGLARHTDKERQSRALRQGHTRAAEPVARRVASSSHFAFESRGNLEDGSYDTSLVVYFSETHAYLGCLRCLSQPLTRRGRACPLRMPVFSVTRSGA